jgi:hypothetical protein
VASGGPAELGRLAPRAMVARGIETRVASQRVSELASWPRFARVGELACASRTLAS